MIHIKRIDEMHGRRINEENKIDYNDIKQEVEEMQKKYYKYDPEKYGFVGGNYDGGHAWIISVNIPEDEMEILWGDEYTEEDARKCLKNPMPYKRSLETIWCGEWEDYNSLNPAMNLNDWYPYEYKVYHGLLELSDKGILNELSFSVGYEGDEPGVKSIPNEIYTEYCDRYIEIFKNTFPYKQLEILGTNARHVCLDSSDFELTDWLLYPQMVDCVKELQDRMIEELESNFWQVGDQE